MDFYNYKVKDIRKEIVDFNKGTYGKTIFVIAYSIPLILAIVAVLIELLGTPKYATTPKKFKKLPKNPRKIFNNQ